MRLFTALWPPAEVVAALAAAMGPDPAPPGWRVADAAGWHVTLAFHGEADPGPLARDLERRVRGAPAPRLRLAGAGSFPGVRWAAVEGDLSALVAAAGGDPARFVGHVTLLRARKRRGRSERGSAVSEPSEPWSAHVGPWWRPEEVVLAVSESGRGAPRYRAVHRVPLRTT